MGELTNSNVLFNGEGIDMLESFSLMDQPEYAVRRGKLYLPEASGLCLPVRQDKPGHSCNLKGGYHVNC